MTNSLYQKPAKQIGFVTGQPYEMASRWALEDFVAVAKARLGREVNIARHAAELGKGTEYFEAYADGVADAISILEDLLKDWREGRI